MKRNEKDVNDFDELSDEFDNDIQMQSNELKGADTYSFTYSYFIGYEETPIPLDDEGYTTIPYYVAYDVEGSLTYHPATAVVKPEATVCAIDLREAAGVTTSFDASANPNLLVFVDQNSTMTGDNVVKGIYIRNGKKVFY